MFPTLLKIGPLTLHSYGFMIAVGFLTALFLMQRDGKKRGIDPRLISDMMFWTLIWGLIGTRVTHILMFWRDYSLSDPIGLIAIWKGGLVFQGAAFPVVIYYVYATRKYKLDFWKLGDILIPYAAVGHALGRMGCFFRGCCYGKRTDLLWGIRFPRQPWDLSQPATGSPAYLDHCTRYSEFSLSQDHWSYPVHPTQLLGVVSLVCLCLILLYLRKKWHPFDGFIMPLYIMFYSTYRFFAEFLRGDHNPRVFDLLSYQQVFCIFSVVAGILLFLVLRQWQGKRLRNAECAMRNDKTGPSR